MKKRIIELLILLVILITGDYLFYLLKMYFGTGIFINAVDYLFKSILIFQIFEFFLYKKFFNLNSNKIKIFIFIIVPLILALHISHRLIAIDKFYFFSKTAPNRASSNLWRFDNKLAHTAIPNSSGNYAYYIGDSIKGEVPVFFDSLGYRTVPDSLQLASDTTDLYLGDSFTFGDYIKSENTFPYLTSKLLNHNYLNAGRSAYGLGQMYQLAKELITANKFKYVFIQLSPWLAQRAMHLIGPTYFGYRPFPYFSKMADSFRLNYPVFHTETYYASKVNWRDTKGSYLERLRFLITDGFQIEVLDYYSYLISAIKLKLGLIARPASDQNELEAYFYNFFIQLCQKNNSIPVILKLRYKAKDCQELINKISPHSIIVDLDHDIDLITDNQGKSFDTLFGIHHYIGKDSILFDKHPNIFAHRIMASKIFNTLTGREK